MLFICYPKCSTCKKAKKFLLDHQIEFDERHIVEEKLNKDELKALYLKSGLPLKRFFNTSGNLYKEKHLKDVLPTLSEDEQLELLSTNGMLVKRPILETKDKVLVGFKEDQYKGTSLMPAGYTHYCFGKDVYKHLDDQNIKDLLLRNENCFLIGLHGPDIFFYERWNKTARKMHQEKANTFFEKAQDIIQSEAQLAYILGFICHYLLDSQMHPYIKKMIKNTNMDHFEIESDYDRLLLKRNHQDPLHKEIYEHIRFKEKEICTIQSFFPELSYLDIEKALKGLKRIDHLLKAPSFLKRGLIYGCFHLTFNFHKLQGLIINYHHNKEMEKYNDILDKIYQQALKESLIYLPLYIQNYKKHAPLPERYYHNYK